MSTEIRYEASPNPTLSSEEGERVAGAEKHRLSMPTSGERYSPHDLYVPQLVAAQAALAPDTVALTSGDETLTYQELDTRSAQIASLLCSLGAGPDVLVAICLDRSLSLAIGELAILKAGGAYVPMDPAYPPDRLKFMLNDSQARVLITNERNVNKLPAGQWQVINLDRDSLSAGFRSSDPISSLTRPDQLAYVIYTSGSTGQPKGTLITHRSLLNLVRWHQTTFEIGPTDRASQQASPAFDAAVWELWPYLVSGASIHLCDDSIRTDPEAFRDWVVAQRITVGFVPTGLAERMIALNWPPETALRIMLTGADTLRHFPPPSLPFALVNNYGPTECTVVATSGLVPSRDLSEAQPTIGSPITNTQVYILDEQMKNVPVGESGEIYIGGAGVARGYLNLPELTAERFLPDPFSSEPGGRIYKTGDLAKYLPDGQIAFLGRLDDQLKIRGYRVEPNEIISLLSQHPMVQASVVIARPDSSGEKQLVAYVVVTAGAQLTSGVLRDYLKGFLPDHAVPALFVCVDRLPLTANGKIDREALPPPSMVNVLRESPLCPSPTHLEKRVAAILAQLLGIEAVGVHDNFFLLGGHSLLGTMVIARVRDTFGVDLPLRTIFESPTTAELSSEIERALLAKIGAMSEEETQHLLSAISAGDARRGSC